MPAKITLKELHAKTGELVRRAGNARMPVVITEHGQPIALLGHPSQFKSKRRRRIILPEYEQLMSARPRGDSREDLNAVRGDR